MKPARMCVMSMRLQICAPFIPAEDVLAHSDLPGKALLLSTASARLAGRVATSTRHTLIRHMAVINSYYSNLIEGHRTLPHEIRAAQQGEFSRDPAKRDLQLESLAHIQVQQWLMEQNPDVDTLYQPEFIQAIHREFYQVMPSALHELKDTHDKVVDRVMPGQWRAHAVTVGQHHPPQAADIPQLMAEFCEVYHPSKYTGDRKVIAVMCAHHRFSWLHPFADGNGRVMRLFTDTALKAIGMESAGVWCLSRGLARAAVTYKAMLARADEPRKGDLDGRGELSQSGLIDFCAFMLDTALDQVSYTNDLLALEGMQQRITQYIQARNDGRVAGLGPIKANASQILYNAYIQGKLKRSAALELCGMPERSARRLLTQLKDEGLLSETSSRSDLQWEIPAHAEPWYFPLLTPGV
jgi:Fic family protein